MTEGAICERLQNRIGSFVYAERLSLAEGSPYYMKQDSGRKYLCGLRWEGEKRELLMNGINFFKKSEARFSADIEEWVTY